MSIPTEIAEGPRGPVTVYSITKKTVMWSIVAVVLTLLSLLTVIWVIRTMYIDTRADLNASRAETQCAREINAETAVVQGEFLQELGEHSEQIAAVFKALPLSGGASTTDFANELAKFGDIERELERLRGLFDQALTRQSQVNDIC